MLKSLARYGAALAIIQALSACGSSPVADAPKNKPKQVEQKQYDRLVVAFGDSLYAGYQLAPGEGLVPQLEAALQKEGINARVHNAGVSGDTTAAGKQRLLFLLTNLERKPDLFVLGLGGNDMLRGIKPAETEANLRAMLDELKKRKIAVVLTGMVATPSLGADYAKEFNPIYARLAKEYGAQLMPFLLDGVAGNAELQLGDHIHPNSKGVAKMVEGLAPLVESKLKTAN
jgi:acyl-CoA thioesterase I